MENLSIFSHLYFNTRQKLEVRKLGALGIYVFLSFAFIQFIYILCKNRKDLDTVTDEEFREGILG